MKLYLIRHGEAEAGAPDDMSRNLTERGEFQALCAARWLAKNIKGPVTIWASPYLRTQQTAAPIAKALSIDIIAHTCLQPEMTPHKVVDELYQEQNDIILITHLPLVGRLASLLTEGTVLDQSWSPAEIWQLEGDVFAAGCLVNTDVWYPV
ncbi:MAG: phosphohistidine phosphatase [Oleispira sp.]